MSDTATESTIYDLGINSFGVNSPSLLKG